ncbi:MAG: murein transglycosylase, partial [Sandaracinaceae bacterium]
MLRALSAAAVLGALASAGATAHAQDRADPGAADPGLEGLVDGDESPELRALRLAEQEIFGGQPLAPVPDAAGAVRVSDGPAAVTSDTPRRAAETPQSSRDLSWLRGLTLPDIPVRWDERVIRYLEYFRNDPRGRDFIRGWLRRVDRYGPMIRRVLREQGLPQDLIFVAMVESGFDPTARSHAGAA